MNKFTLITNIALLLALLAPTTLAQAPTGAGSAAGPAAPPSGWQVIKVEDFEGTFPDVGWEVKDVKNDGYDRKWGRDDFKPYGGTWSVWPASGGNHAVDPGSGVYPNDLDTQMIYGPFDLSDALDAQVDFWLWLETEVGFGDALKINTSADGSIFAEREEWEGSLDWTEITVDLADYIGDDTVWVRWDFHSDESVGLGGAFIDDINISKLPLTAPVTSIGHSNSDVTLSWASVAEATSYEVWRATNTPYFTPGTDCAAPPAGMTCTLVSTTSHTDTGALGSTTNNYSYVVLSVTGNIKSHASNRVGEFDFSLTRGG